MVLSLAINVAVKGGANKVDNSQQLEEIKKASTPNNTNGNSFALPGGAAPQQTAPAPAAPVKK
jgi:hypothetical protein